MKGQRESLEKFELNAPWKPAGDQPQAIEKLISGLKKACAIKLFLELQVAERPSL